MSQSKGLFSTQTGKSVSPPRVVMGSKRSSRRHSVLPIFEPESIGYVEAHTTGPRMGDPVEFEALRKAFRTYKKRFCGIGSVKTNIDPPSMSLVVMFALYPVCVVTELIELSGYYFFIPVILVGFGGYALLTHPGKRSQRDTTHCSS